MRREQAKANHWPDAKHPGDTTVDIGGAEQAEQSGPRPWLLVVLFVGLFGILTGTTWLTLSMQQDTLQTAMVEELGQLAPAAGGNAGASPAGSGWASYPNAFAVSATSDPFYWATVIHLMIALGAVLLVHRMSGAAHRERLLAAFNRTLSQEVEERRRIESALRRANQEAMRANRSKTEVLANVSHELRTPLNAILGFSDILRRGVFGPLGSSRYESYATDIHQSGNHLLELINDILDISKIEARKANLDESEVALDEIARASHRIVVQRADAQGVRVSFELSPGLPALYADQRAIKQILINLLTNAVKFTPAGGRITVRMATTPQDEVRLEVSDTGVGMAPEEIPLALEPFGQTMSSRWVEQEGTGLGLALVKLLVEAHGGSFDLSSRLGEGTTAVAHFPAERTVRALPIAESA